MHQMSVATVRPPKIAAFAEASWDELRTDAHTVQFYEDDEFLLDGLSRFIGAALLGGDSAVIIATKSHREELNRRLTRRGLDLAPAVTGGRYVALDAATTLSKFMVDGRPDAEQFFHVTRDVMAQLEAAAQPDNPRIAAFGEMVALLWREGKPNAAIQLEQLWNEVARTSSFHLHCAYPIQLFRRENDSELLKKICAEHSHVVPSEGYTELVTEEERRRAVIFLQQKAQALETEILERKQADQLRRELEEDLRTSEKLAAVGRLAATIAHEINNPLEAVTNFMYLARHEPDLPEKAKDYLRCADRELRRVSHIARQTLGFYRDDSQPEEFRVARAIDDVLTIYESRFRYKRLQIEKRIQRGLNVCAVQGEFKQILSNLIANAIDASKERGRILLRARETRSLQSGQQGIRVTIADEGVGISSENVRKLFTPFFTTKREVGTGLGLWVTKDLIEKRGGRVFFRSHAETRSGTTMSFFIPTPAPTG